MPYDSSQDTTPFQQIFERLRHPERHEYLFERDGMSAHRHQQRLLEEAVHPGRLTCSTTSCSIARPVRKPFTLPVTDADWAAIQVTAIGQRPPETSGAPGPACAPKLEGGSEVGDTVEVTDLGVWARFSEKPRNYNFIWLRDGAPMAQLQRRADRRRGRPVHRRRRADLHAHRRRRRARDQLPGHGAEPEGRPGQRVLADHQRDRRRGQAAARHPRPRVSGSSTLTAGLPEAYRAESSGSGTVDSLEVYVEEGSSANWLVAGIYSNYHNHPDLLLATGEVRINRKRTGGWETVDIGSVKLAKDTKYWIAVLGVGGELNVRNYDGANGFSPSETYKRTKGDAAAAADRLEDRHGLPARRSADRRGRLATDGRGARCTPGPAPPSPRRRGNGGRRTTLGV